MTKEQWIREEALLKEEAPDLYNSFKLNIFTSNRDKAVEQEIEREIAECVICEYVKPCQRVWDETWCDSCLYDHEQSMLREEMGPYPSGPGGLVE